MKKHLLKLLLLCCIGILALSMFACVPSTDQYKLDFIVDGEVYYSRKTNGYSRINPPTDPVKDGYLFAGWYFDEEYTVEYHSYSLEKDPIKEDTKVYAKWDKSDSHTCVAGEWEESVAATCKSEGQEVKRCTVDYCDKILETRVIPISANHPSTYTVEKDRVNPTCSDEGYYITAEYCTVCNKQISEDKKLTLKVDKDAHVYTNNILTKVGDSFEFDAECSLCKKYITLQNVVVETVVVKAPTCTATGLVNYIYSGFGGATLENVEIPAKGHMVAGVEITDKVYSEIYDKEVLEKVELYENDAKCGDPVDGLFICETCNTYCNIRVEKPHVGTWEEVTAPTCHSRGTENLPVCSACNKFAIKRYPSATGEHIIEGLALKMNKDLGTFDLVVPCVNAGDGCTYFEIRLADVPVTSEEIVGVDCNSPDVIRYTYEGGGERAIYDDIIRDGHFLNGVRASTLQDAEGWFDYRLVTPFDQPGGIKLFADRVLECDDKHTGYYDCTTCKEKVVVEIYRPHSGSWITTIPATCEKEGVSNFYCDFCDYGHDGKVTESLSKTVHSYAWRLVIDKSAEGAVKPFNLVGSCITCEGRVTKTIKNVLVTARVSKNPTCHSVGEIVYACEYQGREYYVTEEISKVDHSIDGVIVNTMGGGRFDYAEYVLTGKIKLDAPEIIVCNSDVGAPGRFTCSECQESVSVNVYRTHSGEIVETLDPASNGCVKIGTRHLDCIYGNCEGTEPVRFEEYNHDYIVDLNNATGTYTVVVSCKADGCELNKTPVVYKDIASVDIKIITLATCLASGEIEYSFRYDGKVYTFFTVIENGNHTFHGVDYTTLLDGNGCLPKDTEGIIKTDADTYAFKCEICDHFIKVNVTTDEE